MFKQSQHLYANQRCGEICNLYPNIAGVWNIEGFSIQYTSIDDPNRSLIPTRITFLGVDILQNGRFFSYDAHDGRLPKLGVLEPLIFDGKFGGWKGHMVDTRFDNENFIFNFTVIDDCGNVNAFDITYTESGFQEGNPDQVPRVEHAYATRVLLKF